MIRVVNKSNNPIPQYKTHGAACFDIASNINFTIGLNEIIRVPTGLYFEIQPGYEVEIRPRSGLACDGILAIQGTIDADYRGEICVILHNVGDDRVTFKIGDRIAQGKYQKAEQTELKEVLQLSETKRGKGGFGHTGV